MNRLPAAFFGLLTLAAFGPSVQGAENPVLVATFNSGRFSRDLRMNGTYAYLINGAAGMDIVDISKPTRPELISHYPAQYFIHDIAFLGTHAFVGDDGPAGPLGFLEILDISDLSAPIRAGLVPGDGVGGKIAFFGNHALVTDVYQGLRVFDISNPVLPVAVGFLSISGGAHDVLISGDLAYVVDNNNGLLVIDVSDPAVPVQKGRASMPAHAYEVTLSGDYAYVGASSGVHIINVSNPAAPVRVGAWTGGQGGRGDDIAISGKYAVVTDLENVHVLDLSNPTAPVRVGMLNTPGQAYGVEILGNHAYVSGTALHVLELSPVPKLNIEAAPGAIRLTWPGTSNAWMLEQCDQLDSAAGWSLIPPPYGMEAGRFYFSAPLSAEQQFFRLRRP